MTAIALTIAGSDSGGGAGIQADLKTFSALGVYGTSVITAVTAQNTCAVTAVQEIDPAIIKAQIDAVFDDIEVNSVKIGMLSSTAIIDAVASALANVSCPIVLDPVMVAKSGDALLADEAVSALRSTLLPRATLLTPNLPEASTLLDQPADQLADDTESMVKQGEALMALGPSAVLVKGGHGSGEECVDVLLSDESPRFFTAARLNTKNTHGTGCTLSSAVAAHLALGHPLAKAVELSHTWLHEAIKAADNLAIGNGHGPVHHFHRLWS